MSDGDAIDQRAASEIRERIVRVEAATTEIPRVRERVHELVNCTQRLVMAAEEAGDQRREMVRKIDDLADEVKSGALVSTRTEAQLGATMAAHIEQCKTDKAEIKAMVAAQNHKQDRMHADNQLALEQTKSRLTRIEIRLAAYIGGAVAVTWLLAHGAELFAKIIK